MRSNTPKWLWQVPGGKKGYIAALTTVQMITGGTDVLHALLLKKIVNSATAHDSSVFWYAVLMLALLIAAQLSFQALIRFLNELSRASLENTFKHRLMNQIMSKDFSSVCAVHSGEWMNRLTNDTVVVANGYVEILPGLAGMLVRLVSALVMLIVLDGQFAIVLLPGGAALITLTYAFRKRLKRLHKQMQEKDGIFRVFLQERIGSLMIVKSFGAEEQAVEEADGLMNDHKAARVRKNHFSNVCNFGFGAAMHSMYLFGVVYCAFGILNHTASYGTLAAVMQLIGQIQAPFANISGYLPRWYAMIASAERLMEIEGYAEDEQATDRKTMRRYYEQNFHVLGLRNASFAYWPAGEEAMPMVLDGMNLEIRKGETVAFIGHSGCGKSTVLKLLLCMYPLDGGERYLDDQPLTAAHRRLFAYVPQGNALMNGTIMDVVCFAEPYDENRL